MGKAERQTQGRALGSNRGEGRQGASRSSHEGNGKTPQEATPAPKASLAEYAASNRARHTGVCEFCKLPEPAKADLATILAKNAAGEWCLTIAAAWVWFRDEHGYGKGTEAFRNHVRRCIGHEWTAR